MHLAGCETQFRLLVRSSTGTPTEQNRILEQD